jgi:hypothetical protein
MRGHHHHTTGRRIRFPNRWWLRIVQFFRRRRPKNEADGDASAFFEGCTKYEEVETVHDSSFSSSDSCPSPVSASDSGSDESAEEAKRRMACCVDDYMMMMLLQDDGSVDQLSTFLVVRLLLNAKIYLYCCVHY